jgi:DNA-binding LacI/PurR family transcriptional regulator
VVGFDDIPEARFFGPPLTTVRQDFAALGQRLMVRVEDTLGEKRFAGPQLLQPELIVRASTASA